MRDLLDCFVAALLAMTAAVGLIDVPRLTISRDKSGLSLPSLIAAEPWGKIVKSFIAAVIFAVVAAFGASLVLNDFFQKPVETAYSTGSVRL
ncbi:hypothetical protein BHK69_10550 [Bosea vaviloviae]|uniref:Uncharacterized protein n=1 Tax=Bosea vaviloviae TaxID=1526658 RepID=A0A1D7U0E5_9HYPH|nr:hypothetical protein BHK69_10550 [Bosea vaviloviae]